MRNTMFWVAMGGMFLVIFGVTTLSMSIPDGHTLLTVVGGIATVAGALTYILVLRRLLAVRRAHRKAE